MPLPARQYRKYVMKREAMRVNVTLYNRVAARLNRVACVPP